LPISRLTQWSATTISWPPPPRAKGWTTAAWAAALVALAAVFASYLNPHLALDIANRVWACF
jgi:hypothetical protein